MCSSPKNSEADGTKRLENEKSKVGPTEMEIHEWHMELRTNNVCMDEHTSEVRMEKIKNLEKCEAQRRQDIDRISQERDRVSEERDRTNTEKQRANAEKERTITAREQVNDERENSNKLRESANVEREEINKDREIANDKREILHSWVNVRLGWG